MSIKNVCHEGLIESTSFGMIASYLHGRCRFMEYILHVKDKAVLPALADELRLVKDDACITPREIPHLRRLLAEGAILISSRWPLPLQPHHIIDAAAIPTDAPTFTITQPPFALAHTPGLFEGTLIREAPEEPKVSQTQARRSKGIRL